MITAVGAALAAGLLWWYGRVWPRRAPREPIDPNRSPYGRRRYPGLDLRPPAVAPPPPSKRCSNSREESGTGSSR